MVDWPLAVEVLNAFAWPIAFVVVLMIFRQPIVEILGKLQKLKVSGFEVEMRDKVAALDEKVAKSRWRNRDRLRVREVRSQSSPGSAVPSWPRASLQPARAEQQHVCP